MQVYIKNKLFSLGGSSAVYDLNKQPVYNVKGNFFSITRKKKIKDLNGNTLYTLRNRWFNWFLHKVYIYDASGKKIAMVKDKLFNFKKQYFVVGYGDEITTEGKFLSLSMTIFKNGEPIGKISREITLIADAFCLAADEKDIPFLIALVIAIDNIVDKIRKD